MVILPSTGNSGKHWSPNSCQIRHLTLIAFIGVCLVYPTYGMNYYFIFCRKLETNVSIKGVSVVSYRKLESLFKVSGVQIAYGITADVGVSGRFQLLVLLLSYNSGYWKLISNSNRNGLELKQTEIRTGNKNQNKLFILVVGIRIVMNCTAINVFIWFWNWNG